MTDNEKKNREELFRLMQENPDLPVIPLVDGELGGNEYVCYLGAWGRAQIDEYVMADVWQDNKMLFKSDNDISDTLECYFDPAEFDELPDDDEKCKEIYDNLPWTKAIFVYIGIPD